MTVTVTVTAAAATVTTTVRSIKAILFDLDGTLVDTETLSDKAILYALKIHLGDAWAEQFQDDNNNNSNRLPWELKRQLLGLRGSEWGPIVIDYAIQQWNLPKDKAPTVAELWSSWEQHLNSFSSQVKACVGATELVDKLSELQIPMAVATSSRMAMVEQKRTNHESKFSKMTAIVAGDHEAVKNGKPAPDIYLEAARQMGVSPAECLVMEDALSGVQSGKAAGCAVVAIPDARFTTAEKLVFSSLADVVVQDLNHFDGTPFGVDLKMPAAP